MVRLGRRLKQRRAEVGLSEYSSSVVMRSDSQISTKAVILLRGVRTMTFLTSSSSFIAIRASWFSSPIWSHSNRKRLQCPISTPMPHFDTNVPPRFQCHISTSTTSFLSSTTSHNHPPPSSIHPQSSILRPDPPIPLIHTGFSPTLRSPSYIPCALITRVFGTSVVRRAVRA